MLKKTSILGLAALVSVSAFADILISVPDNSGIEQIKFFSASLDKYINGKTIEERGIKLDRVPVVSNRAKIDADINENYIYGIGFSQGMTTLFLQPGETVNLDVMSVEPLQYKLSGTPIAEALGEIAAIEAPFTERSNALQEAEEPDEAAYEALSRDYSSAMKNYINQNPESPAMLMALMNLNGEDFIEIFDSLSETQKKSIIYPMAEKQYQAEKRSLELEKQQKALMSGEVTAPGFTLKDLEGKDVSLSDFRGKWVILDFWGSWCVWCIRGIPELKEAYQKYAGKLEIIGIDCNESKEDWKAGVKKYELPWVNVYNPKDSNLTAEYGVQGFPTKAIIDPDGKIRNITTGHDPNFFNILSELLGE